MYEFHIPLHTIKSTSLGWKMYKTHTL